MTTHLEHAAPQWSRPLTGAERPEAYRMALAYGRPQWSRPLTGAERQPPIGLVYALSGSPQWSRPLTGAERGGRVLAHVGADRVAAMEPPPHGGGETPSCETRCGGQYGPQWSRPLTGAESTPS